MREKETHMAKKYNVVWRGKQTGVFSTWKQCKQQVHGFPDAKYKSFTSKEEAKLAYEKGPDTTKKQTGYIGDSISVDAACSGNPGVMEYQGVHTRTGKQIFHYGPVPKGTRSEEHTSELQSRGHIVCRLLLEKKKEEHYHST